MRTDNLPLFALASTRDHLILAGGGGDRAYGKQNGIIIVPKNALEAPRPPVAFFETEDIIRLISVFQEGEPYTEFEPDENSCDESPAEVSAAPPTALDSILIAAAGIRYFYLIKYTFAEPPQAGSPTTQEVALESSSSNEEQPAAESEDKNSKSEAPTGQLPVEPTAGTLTATQPSSSSSSSGLSGAASMAMPRAASTGTFTLIKRYDTVVDALLLTKHLFLLHDHTLKGAYAPFDRPGKFILGSRKQTGGDPEEEFFYKIFRKGSALVYKRECGTQDVPDTWAGFFVRGQYVHKVMYENGVSTFVFNGRKYGYGGQIKRVAVLQAPGQEEGLCFYVNGEAGRVDPSQDGASSAAAGENATVNTPSGSDNSQSEGSGASPVASLAAARAKANEPVSSPAGFSTLCFIFGRDERMYRLPRITVMGVDGEWAAVATVEGDVILYRRGLFYGRKHVAELPVSGVAVEKTTVFYGLINGRVEKCVMGTRWRLWTGAVLALLVALLVALAAGKYKW